MFDEYISHYITSQIILNRINSLKSHQIPLSMKSNEIPMTSHEIPMKSQEMSIYFHEIMIFSQLTSMASWAFPAVIVAPRRWLSPAWIQRRQPRGSRSTCRRELHRLGLGLELAMWG